MNETSGGLGKIGAVSGSDCGILKFLRTTFLAAKLLGWKVSVKGIRSSLFEADGSESDSLLTFWTRLSALDKMLPGWPRSEKKLDVLSHLELKSELSLLTLVPHYLDLVKFCVTIKLSSQPGLALTQG